MKRLWNPGYTGSPWMPGTLYNELNRYGEPSPPPGSEAMVTEIDGDLMVTELLSDSMVTE